MSKNYAKLQKMSSDLERDLLQIDYYKQQIPSMGWIEYKLEYKMDIWTFNAKSKPTNKGSAKGSWTAAILLFLKTKLHQSGKAPNIADFWSSMDIFKVTFLNSSKESYICFVSMMKE